MNYEQFCIELEKRFDNQKIKDSKAKYLFLNKGYIPSNAEFETIVRSANLRLTKKDFAKYLLEDFLIVVVSCYGIKTIAYLPMRGLFYEFEDYGWDHILETIKDVTNTMKKSML